MTEMRREIEKVEGEKGSMEKKGEEKTNDSGQLLYSSLDQRGLEILMFLLITDCFRNSH